MVESNVVHALRVCLCLRSGRYCCIIVRNMIKIIKSLDMMEGGGEFLLKLQLELREGPAW